MQLSETKKGESDSSFCLTLQKNNNTWLDCYLTQVLLVMRVDLIIVDYEMKLKQSSAPEPIELIWCLTWLMSNMYKSNVNY